jgi:DNA-binding transcriptional MerR regulator
MIVFSESLDKTSLESIGGLKILYNLPYTIGSTMTAINDLPDEPKYSVQRVSDLTGILPVTLRAWERRYGILNPGRDENRYRLYSDRDLAILRWLINKKNSGVSISNASANLHEMIKHNNWPEVIPFGIAQAKTVSAVPPQRYADDFFELLKEHNEVEAARLFEEVISKFDLETLIEKIITPTLSSVGEAWFQGEIMISTEHFATAFLLSRLNNLYISLPIVNKGRKILIGGAPSEEHEMGALMMAVLLRNRGYRVEFLGANLHLDDLVDYSQQEKPALVVLTASTNRVAMELLRAQAKLNTIAPAPKFCYAGFAFDYYPELVNKIPGIYLGNSMVKALDQIKQLLSGE